MPSNEVRIRIILTSIIRTIRDNYVWPIDENKIAVMSIRLRDVVSGVFRGALAPGPPFQPTLIFYDGIFGCFTIFFLLKHQNLGIQ